MFFLFQSEPEGFSHFHLYVCAAFLVRWRREILEERDFQVSNCSSEEPLLCFLLKGLLSSRSRLICGGAVGSASCLHY